MRERTYRVAPEKMKEARGTRRASEVAARLSEMGLTPQKLWNYENGYRDVPESYLRALCQLYRVGLRSVLADEVAEQENVA